MFDNVHKSRNVKRKTSAQPTHFIATRCKRLNKEIKRRTRVACLFPHPEGCLRRVSALLCEQDEDWASGKIYLTMSPENTTQ